MGGFSTGLVGPTGAAGSNGADGAPGAIGPGGQFERTLNGATAVNDVSVTINAAPFTNLGGYTYAVIDPFTSQCEVRKVTNISGTEVFFSGGLNFTHANGDQVVFSYEPWAYAAWWAVKGDGNNSGANLNAALAQGADVVSTNPLAANRHFSRLVLPFGQIGTNVPIDVPHEMGLIGTGCLSSDGSTIKALTGFPTGGNNAIIRALDANGNAPTHYTTALAELSRITLRDLGVDGSSITGVNGILTAPQQPSPWFNIRVGYCIGLYGLSLHDGQQFSCDNLTFQNCGTNALDIKGTSFVYINDLNIEGGFGTSDIYVHRGLSGGYPFSCQIENVHFETYGGPVVRNVDLQTCRNFIVENAHVTVGTPPVKMIYADRRGDTEPIHWHLRDATQLGNSDNLDFVHDVNKTTYKGATFTGGQGYRIPASPSVPGTPTVAQGAPTAVVGPAESYLVAASSKD